MSGGGHYRKKEREVQKPNGSCVPGGSRDREKACVARAGQEGT